MKSRCSLVALLILVAMPQSHAAQDEKISPAKRDEMGATQEWAERFRGVPLPVVWQTAQTTAASIAAAVEAKNFARVPEWGETVHLAVHALVDQVKLDDPERQKRLNGALNQAAKIADDIRDAANRQEWDELAVASRRMNVALELAAKRLPMEVLAAPSQAGQSGK